MPRLEEHLAPRVRSAVAKGAFRLEIGQFSIKITSTIPEFADALIRLYAGYPASVEGGAYDFDIAISPASFFRQWARRNASFVLSGEAPFLPMHVNHAHALFEWGLNWTIGSYAHQYLILHSAVMEKRGCGVLLSATSGSGKSTLAAELALSGWRLLSDELALVDQKIRLVPCTRPVSLKNQSIDIVRERHPEALLGPVAADTHKGTIAHLPAPETSISRSRDTALPKLIVFPKWSAEARFRLEPLGSGQAAMRLIDQSFNYPILGRQGFERLVELVHAAEAWEMDYSSLDDARTALEQLVYERA